MLSSSRIIELSKLLIDFVSVNIAFGLANLIIFDHFWVDGWAYPSLFLVVNLSCFIAYKITNQNLVNPSLKLSRILSFSSRFSIIVFLITLVYWLIIDSQKYYVVHLLLLLCFLFSFVFINKFLWSRFLKIFSNRVYRRKKVLLVGNESELLLMKSIIEENNWLNYRAKVLDYSNISIDDFQLFIDQENIQIVFIDCSKYFDKIGNMLSKRGKEDNIKFYGFNLPSQEIKGRKRKLIFEFVFYELN